MKDVSMFALHIGFYAKNHPRVKFPSLDSSLSVKTWERHVPTLVPSWGYSCLQVCIGFTQVLNIHNKVYVDFDALYVGYHRFSYKTQERPTKT